MKKSKLRMKKQVRYSCANPRPSAKVCGRSRRHRERLLPRYLIHRISHEQMVSLPADVLEGVIREFAEDFNQQLRVHEFALKRPYQVIMEHQYDIDYNVEKFIFEQKFKLSCLDIGKLMQKGLREGLMTRNEIRARLGHI